MTEHSPIVYRQLPPRPSARRVAKWLGMRFADVLTALREGEFRGAYRRKKRWVVPREAVQAWEAEKSKPKK